MEQTVLIIAGIYGALAVVLGAFGAHLLKDKFTKDLLNSFETGVRYQLFHALVLLVIGFNLNLDSILAQRSAWLFILGTFLFSFSIYGLCFSSISGKKLKFLGPVTPIGGLCLIIAWILLIIEIV